MARQRPPLLAAVFALLMGAAGFTFAADSAANPVRLAMPETVALGADDTLELTLQTPKVPNDGSSTAPEVSVSIFTGAEVAQPGARVLVSPSPRPGEWLVHVRGLKAPEGKAGLCDILVRWKFANDAKLSGEAKLARAIDFKSEAAEVVLLMDGSLSLGRTDPKRMRVDAARAFIANARETGSIGRIGIVQFDNKSRTLIGLSALDNSFEKALEQLDERGQTDIDGGIRHALKLLQSAQQNGATAAGTHIILFTDGEQEPGVYGNAHEEAAKAGVAIHTVALGREADRKLLRRIAAETGGTFADSPKDSDLALAYAAIASRIARTRAIFSAPLAADGKAAIPVDGACRSLNVSIGGERSGTLTVTSPAGQSWQSSQQVRPEYFVELPESGNWSAHFAEDGKHREGAAPFIAASARTALYPVIFRSDPAARASHELDTDEPFVAVSLCEGGDPRGATVQATLNLGEGNAARTITAQLFDDGQHNDGAAGDGIFSAYLPPWPDGGGAYPENATGTLKIVVSGKREGADFRRETETAIVTKRHDGPALIAGGALDLGTRFCGENLSAELSLRVRGAGGALSAKSIEPAGELGNLSRMLTIENPPASLKARERTSIKLHVALPELLVAGDYGGRIEFQLAGAETIRVPWHVRVTEATLLAPESIDLGELQPGDKAPIQLRLKTNGGTLTIASAQLSAPGKDFLAPLYPLTIARRAPELLSCSPDGADLDLEFDLAPDAAAGSLQRTLILRDFSCREVARVQLNARVQSQALSVDAPLSLGAVEPGDALAREVRWKWQREGLRAPANAAVKIWSSGASPIPALTSAQLKDGAAVTQFSLNLPRDAKPGEIGGWVSIEAGPVIALQRWSANVVQPRLDIDKKELDFSTLIQGQKRTLKLTLHADGARPIDVKLAAPAALPKTRLPHIKLPAEAVKISEAESSLAPGNSKTLSIELEIPDAAQDGSYKAPLTLSSRLGTISIPASITVINEIEPAAFHVTPSTLPLRFDIRSKLPRDSVSIISHRDDPIALKLELKPVKAIDGSLSASALPATFVVSDLSAGDETHSNLSLPGRDTIEVFVQARPDAQAGERCRLHISGNGEEHVVEILIERNAPPHFASTPTETPRLLNWLVFLLIALTAAAAYAVNRMVKRAWVRYAFYSVLFHLAFLPWAMPRQTLLEALPDSVQISLLESEDALGGALSEQQMRRLEALKTGGPEEKVTLASGDGLAAVKSGDKLPDLAAKDIARAGTPGASTLEATQAPEARVEPAGGPTQRAPASPGADAPLSSEALAPNPLPAATPAPIPAPAIARSVAPENKNEPLPATISAPQPRVAAPSSDVALPSALNSVEPSEARTVLPSEAAPRVIKDQPAADAPLEVASLVPDSKPAPASAAPLPSPVARNAPPASPGTAGSPKLSVPLPAAGGGEAGGGKESSKAARSEDLALNSDLIAEKIPGPPGGGDSTSAKRSAGGVGVGAIDDPLDAGVLLGGVSPNGKGETATGGKASGAAGSGSGGIDPNSPRGGTALGALGNGVGDGELAFAAGLGSGNGRGNSSGAGRGAGSALPGFNIGTDVGGGQPGLPGGGNGTGRKPGGAGTGGDDDSPLSAGPITGGIGGVGNGSAISAKAGLPGGTGEGAGQVARGGSALRNGFAVGGTGTELALAGSQPHEGVPGFGEKSELARAGIGAGNGGGETPVPGVAVGATRKAGGTGAGGDGDSPLNAGPIVGGTGTGGKGVEPPTGSPAGVPGGTGSTLARGGTALGSGIAPDGTGTELALFGPPQRGVPGGGGGSTKDLPHVGVGTANGSGIGGNNGTATRPSAESGAGETDLPLVADQIGNGKAPAGNGVGTAQPGAGPAQPGRVAAAGAFGSGSGFGTGNTTGGLAGLPGTDLAFSGLSGKTPGGGSENVRKSAAQLIPGPTSQQLEDAGGAGKMKGLRGGTLPNWRVVGEHHTGGLVRLNMGLAKHSGDWNSSPTALHHLRAAFIERSGLPELEVNVLTLDLSNLKQMSQCRMIMITSNLPIVFKPEEITAMNQWIAAGGTLWVNDSSASDFEGFDKAFRPVASQIVPGGKLESLPLTHSYFISCYDLSKGYKGFRVPPGDKYRQDYIEGVMVPDEQAAEKGIQAQRAGIIYTRNDYSDGLEIDPRMNAGMKSLTDLTNSEMLEASLRFGMNLLAYSMGSNAPKLPPPPESTAQFEKIYRYNGPPLPALDDFTLTQDQWNKPIWNAEKEWCNDTQLTLLDDAAEKTKVLSLRFEGGTKFKAAVTRNLPTDLSNADALVLDLYSDLKSGSNVALLFNSKGNAYECRPVFARPGWNRGLRFPLNLGDMKSNSSKEPWKDYDTPFEPRNKVERISVLIYNLNESGAVKIGPIRVERKK